MTLKCVFWDDQKAHSEEIIIMQKRTFQLFLFSPCLHLTLNAPCLSLSPVSTARAAPSLPLRTLSKPLPPPQRSSKSHLLREVFPDTPSGSQCGQCPSRVLSEHHLHVSTDYTSLACLHPSLDKHCESQAWIGNAPSGSLALRLAMV